MRTSSIGRQNIADVFVQFSFSILLGFTAFFLVMCILFLGFQVWYAGRIFPGVLVGGIDVSGLQQKDAVIKLSQQLTHPTQGHILLHDQQQSWDVSPVELGLFLDTESSIQKAYSIGRKGLLRRVQEQFNALYNGINLAPSFILDQRMMFQYLNNLATLIDRPVIEASLSLQGTEVMVHSGQNGRKLDMPATIESLTPQLQQLQDSIVELKVQETPAIIVDASAQAELARQILSQPLTLSLPEGQQNAGPWIFDPPALAAMLNLERIENETGETYQVTLNSNMLRTFLQGEAPQLVQSPQNARFIFNDETRQLELLQPAVMGREIDIERSIQDIQHQIVAGEHNIPLQFIYYPASITDEASAESLGITELVRAEISYFYGSDAERIQNIAAAASKFHGLLVPPGATFSMAQTLGAISLENGYAEAWIIYGNQTIKGVGGGVCQVSTTLFRAAFFAGFPIVERHPHAYRVYYYEKTANNQINPNLAGLDATVYVPVVDFKFTNDTPHWLLMETYVNESARTITWKLYSTLDGRTVEWETSGPTNVVPEPEPLYVENEELAQGEIKQVDWGVDGADVSVSRTVYKDGSVYLQDTFFTHYKPWQDRFEYGPGTENIPTPSAENTNE